MAPKATAPAGDETADAAAGGQSPSEVLDLLRGGLTFNGVRVLTLRVELVDGTTQRLQMPAPSPPAKDWTATKPGAAILEVLATEGRPLKGSAIAVKAKYSYNGSFRSALKGLVEQGEIGHDEDDGYELLG
jgi:hypothetical protein